VIIVSASRDRLVSNAAQAIVAERLPQGRLVTVEGAEHEILMETDPLRSQFWTHFDALAEQVAPKD
jgi:lysophospholipase